VDRPIFFSFPFGISSIIILCDESDFFFLFFHNQFFVTLGNLAPKMQTAKCTGSRLLLIGNT
jgi:hypothetical protein